MKWTETALDQAQMPVMNIFSSSSSYDEVRPIYDLYSTRSQCQCPRGIYTKFVKWNLILFPPGSDMNPTADLRFSRRSALLYPRSDT